MAVLLRVTTTAPQRTATDRDDGIRRILGPFVSQVICRLLDVEFTERLLLLEFLLTFPSQ